MNDNIQDEYRRKWIEAERDLAINSYRAISYFSMPEQPKHIKNTFVPSNPSEERDGTERHFTQDDFINDLKKVSRRIKTSKPSPKSSKT